MSKFQKPKKTQANYIKFSEEERIQNILPSIDNSSDYQESNINSFSKINNELLGSLLNKRKDIQEVDLRDSLYDIKSDKTKKLDEEDLKIVTNDNENDEIISKISEIISQNENLKNLTPEEIGIKKSKKDIIGGDIGQKVEIRKSKIDPLLFKKKKKEYPYKKNKEQILQIMCLKIVLNKLVTKNEELSKCYIDLRIRDNVFANKIAKLENDLDDLLHDESLEMKIKEKNKVDLDDLEVTMKMMSENLDRVTGENSQELFIKDVLLRDEEYLGKNKENDVNFSKLARSLNNFKLNLINVTSNS